MTPDYIIKNANVFQTFRQCFEIRDVAVRNGRFYSVLAPGGPLADPSVPVYDASGLYMIPGLIDIHMHIESSMTCPARFAPVALSHGTTTIVADAHEIANVFGMEGIEAFWSQKTPLDIFWAIPSSVPATHISIETPGACITEEDAAELLLNPYTLCLGEVMNFKQLAPEDGSDTQIRRMIRHCRKARGRDIRIEGHCPRLSGADLNRFIYEGVDGDHTQQTPESILEKTDLGMFLELQKKSLTPENADTVCRYGLYENIALVTDDTMPDQLLQGHLNHIVRTAVYAGIPVEKAIYCATYTPARRMHLDDRGMIGPGKLADFILLKGLEEMEPAAVVKSGRLAWAAGFKDGEGEKNTPLFPSHFYHSVHCRPAVLEDFILKAPADAKAVTANVMQIHSFGTATRQVQRVIPVKEGRICWQEAGLSLAVLYERHGKNGNVGCGLVEGAFTKPGAAATTWCHDSHNLLVLGTSPEDMILAQRHILRLEGGYTVFSQGECLGEAQLNVGGIINDGPIEALSGSLGRVRAAMAGLGYKNNNEIMSMSTLALPVSPELKLTDRGLLDVKTQKRVELAAAYH